MSLLLPANFRGIPYSACGEIEGKIAPKAQDCVSTKGRFIPVSRDRPCLDQ